MALNSLKIATDGYLKRTSKAALIIAVSGYLNYSDGPVIPPSPVYPTNTHIPNKPFEGGAIGYDDSTISGNQISSDLKRKIAIEDSELIAIVQVTLQNTTL